ncbi:hypothetical protein BOX15_Mlig029636g1 [Macrostomum lignano]|uniref:Deltameth_res domain-containing protein n=1 Tax=Macrostomum lignano TaxID=282301 RepID=A0A267DFA6_9PLAT|nr:hypothetical protein BOX15_Mlig015429g10 [Macrostomum lignano]PAA65826.1 hypothetical protein BOX15_Mlig015429g7 [Macrostomum lignano]PAA76554.1 hypothetical protein BOX15_Mlig029636g4 [Macrostomum lignano]PAA90115.1 hypothetical protein BOX15_Mlig029636g1 [Macrostomum lignano]
MNRILKLASLVATRQSRRALCHHGHHEKHVGIYHSYTEAARSISMNEIIQPTMKYSEGYAHFNAKYNKVFGAGLIVAATTVIIMLGSGYFRVPTHKPMKNTEEGLKFLDYPHEGYH